MIRPVAYHPDLLPPEADEAGSTRYECMITLYKISDKRYKCDHYNLIKEHGTFIIIEHSPEYRIPIEIEYGWGIVVCDSKGEYSWWYHLNNEVIKHD